MSNNFKNHVNSSDFFSSSNKQKETTKKKNHYFMNQCHRCWATSDNLIEYFEDEEYRKLKLCFARCGIETDHMHSLCKKCINKIKLEKEELKKEPKIVKRITKS